MTIQLSEVEIELTTATVEVTRPVVTVEVISAPMPAVEVGVPGPVGPVGPAGPVGLIKVAHGSDPNVVRPDAPLVYWVGSVSPVNADPDDLLLLRS